MLSRSALCVLATCLCVSGFAEGIPEERIPELLVTATLSKQAVFTLPYMADVIDRQAVTERSYRTLPQILRDTPGIMVQETSAGQGSPYIRGLTGYHTLLMIDGVRVNNSIFRAGPNQYWSTVDAHGIQRVEVVNGPTSSLYGSDAVGGTVNVFSREARTTETQLSYRYASAENSDIVRLFHSFGGDDLRASIGLTAKHFGDFVAGHDVDQPSTGYEEYDADVKLNWRLAEDRQLDLLYQRVNQNNVPRTHKTRDAISWQGTEVGSDNRRELDQERELLYAKYKASNLDWALFDNAELTLSWQQQEESRDRIKPSGSRQKQGVTVETIGINGQFAKFTTFGDVTAGLDYYLDQVDSFSSSNAIQGPVADDAEYASLGLYIQDELALNDRASIILGARYNTFDLSAGSVVDVESGDRTNMDDDWHDLTANIRFSYLLNDYTNLFAGISQGFRAPNLSDLTRLDSARTNEFEIPSPGLDPEQFVSYESGFKLDGSRGSFQAAIFYTDIEDLIVRTPTGNLIDGEFEITKRNAGDGYVRGLEIQGTIVFGQHTTTFASYNWQEGESDTYPSSASELVREPIDRMMPSRLQLGLRMDDIVGETTWFEAIYTHAEAQHELSTRDVGDTSRIPPGGTPSYDVLDIAFGWQITAKVNLLTRLDNVTDEAYRIHGSGTNMPGRSLIFSISLDM